MAQIVHDVAPGADLAFATALGGQVNFANNIRALAAAGADVIVDDIIYFTEPVYQDGVIANAVSDVTADGVTYISMAFNNNGLGINSYEAPDYRSTACPAIVAAQPGADDCMDFDPGAGADNMFDVDVTAGDGRFNLNWAEPELGVTTDLNLYVLNTGGTAISFPNPLPPGDNLSSQLPTEFVSGTFGSAGPRQIVIQRAQGAGTPRLKFVSNDNGANRFTSTQAVVAPDVQGPTIYGHNGTAAAQTVGAVPFNNSGVVEPFSSRGPVTHLFEPVNGATPAAALATPEVLNKPDVSATDGGLNSFFRAPCTECRFFGTSAAAPHAAGVAALQLSADPALTQAQVKATQVATADPVGSLGQLEVGAGLVNAIDAIGANPTAPPAAAIGSRPPARSAIAQPTFTFATVGRLRSTSCIVDGSSTPCTSPFTVPAPLATGDHTLTVRATDFYGQSADATASFEVDVTGPKVKVSKGPKPKSTKRKAKFLFSAEAGATFRCKLDKGGFEGCKSPAKFKVKPGKHKLSIRATDDLGNAGAAETYKWKVKKKKRR